MGLGVRLFLEKRIECDDREKKGKARKLGNLYPSSPQPDTALQTPRNISVVYIDFRTRSPDSVNVFRTYLRHSSSPICLLTLAPRERQEERVDMRP
jgi:hypothetical protein